MNRLLQHPITPSDIEAFDRDGVVRLRNQFDAEWCDRMAAASLRHVADTTHHDEVRWHGIANPPPGHSHMCMAQTDEDFRDFLYHSPLAQIARTLMQVETVRYCYDQLFVKERNDGSPALDRPPRDAIEVMKVATAWHQDMPYWPFVGSDILSIWIPFTDVPREAAGLEYVAGSHRGGKVYAPPGMPSERYTEPLPHALTDGADSDRRLSWDCAAGDCIVHRPLTVHRSFANSAATARIALSVRFFGEDAVYDPDAASAQWYPDEANVRSGRPVSPEYFPVVA